ncbi:MAG TPA: YezD family protein [Chthoniobacter sp.]|jgi:hypothetical protein
MSHSLSPVRRSALRADRDEPTEVVAEPIPVTPWLAVVADSVKSIRYGVVQIVIHDARVVQIERTERTRFDVPQAAGGR